MVQVGYENSKEYGEPIRYDLGHEKRYSGTISEVSDVTEMEFKYDDEPKERVVISFRTDLDDLDVDDDVREELREYVNSEIKERKEENLEVDHPEDAVELVMICTAKITPAVGESYSESKLFGTMRKLGLAEADSDGNVTLYDRHGEEVDPFEDLDEEPTAQEENAAFSSYLKQNMTGMEVTYEVSNAKKGTEDEYSSVGKVISLDNDPEAEE